MGDMKIAERAYPSRYFFTGLVAFVEIVIAGTQDDVGFFRQQFEIFLHHYDLGTEVDDRADIKCISRDHNKIEMRSRAHEPVELRQ